MTKQQRDLIIAKNPRAIRKVFTMVELEKYIANDRWVPVPELSLRRGTVALSAEDDVPDPYRRSPETHDKAAAMIVRASHAIADYFGESSVRDQ